MVCSTTAPCGVFYPQPDTRSELVVLQSDVAACLVQVRKVQIHVSMQTCTTRMGEDGGT